MSRKRSFRLDPTRVFEGQGDVGSHLVRLPDGRVRVTTCWRWHGERDRAAAIACSELARFCARWIDAFPGGSPSSFVASLLAVREMLRAQRSVHRAVFVPGDEHVGVIDMGSRTMGLVFYVEPADSFVDLLPFALAHAVDQVGAWLDLVGWAFFNTFDLLVVQALKRDLADWV